VASGGGADFGRYRQWAVVLTAGDIFLLPGGVSSPLGLPLTHWSPGPGMLFAVPGVLLRGVVDSATGPLVAGWLVMLLFWGAFYRILAWASRGDLGLMLLGLGAGFLGTHIGFLARSHASESIAIALVALLTASVIDRRGQLAASSWTVGCCTALLVMTRVHYVVYAVPALSVTALRILDFDIDRRTIRRVLENERPDADQQAVASPFAKRVLAAALVLAPLSIAALQQAFVNRWMTGSVISTPYVFGDASFRSVTWLKPLFVPVLVHPWHGLLAYHPLYALAFFAAVICWRQASSSRERILWAGAVGAATINLWIQASWFAWWLGIGTFGMRGMAPAAVVLVPALVRVIAGIPGEASSGSARPRIGGRAWAFATLACCFWSFLLLRQGITQFHTVGDLLAAQGAAINGMLDVRIAVATSMAAVMVIGAWNWARPRQPSTTIGPWILGAAGLLATLSTAQLLDLAQSRWATASGRLLLPAVLLLVLLGTTFVAVRLGGRLLGALHRQSPLSDVRGASRQRTPLSVAGLAAPLGRLALTLWLLSSCLLFARLAMLTESSIATGDLPDRDFRYRAGFDVESAQTALREYERIDGFEERKEALRRFLEAHAAR